MEMGIFDGLPVSREKAVSIFHSNQIVAAYVHGLVVLNTLQFFSTEK